MLDLLVSFVVQKGISRAGPACRVPELYQPADSFLMLMSCKVFVNRGKVLIALYVDRVKKYSQLEEISCVSFFNATVFLVNRITTERMLKYAKVGYRTFRTCR